MTLPRIRTWIGCLSVFTFVSSLAGFSFIGDARLLVAQEAAAALREADAAAEASAEKVEPADSQAAPAVAQMKLRTLPLSGSYVDQVQSVSLDPTSLILGGGTVKQKSFYKLCEYLDELSAEKDLGGIVFDLSDSQLEMNPAQLDELSRRLERVRQSGKRTVAWLESASNVHYSIAVACDRIILADFGGLDIPSSSMESMFYRDAMDLVGVQASVVRAGDFKGAVEPYLNPTMSDHLRQHYLLMLQSINDAAVARIAKGRGMTVAEVRELQKKRMLLPQDALAKKLVDQLAPYGTMPAAVEAAIGQPIEWVTTAPKAKKEMSLFELFGSLMAGPPTKTAKVRETSIAVLHLSGDIVDGKKPVSGSIVSGPTVETIRELESDDKVAGVVVRINSPGGSATASEVIRQALVSLAGKKPTVISMGSMAASGGYWISCIDQPVYAEQGTITGSIGVFAMKLSFGSLLRRVGVRVEAITLDDSAAAFAIDRTWSDSDVASIQESIDEVYGRFLTLVSNSRKMTVAQVEPLAGGRVWSGTQAKQAGLVDAIGGLDDCLQVVAKKAQLDSYKIIHRPEKQSGLPLMELLGSGDDEEQIFSRSILEQGGRILAQRGFSLETVRLLLQDSVQRGNQPPTIWALHPAELSIR